MAVEGGNGYDLLVDSTTQQTYTVVDNQSVGNSWKTNTLKPWIIAPTGAPWVQDFIAGYYKHLNTLEPGWYDRAPSAGNSDAGTLAHAATLACGDIAACKSSPWYDLYDGQAFSANTSAAMAAAAGQGPRSGPDNPADVGVSSQAAAQIAAQNEALGSTGGPIRSLLSKLGIGNLVEEDSACLTASHSFTANTNVLMADGSTKPIQDVKVGDEVENAQPGGHDEIHRVDQVHVTHTDKDFTDLTVNTPDGPKTITGTQNHPYYDLTTKTFTDASQLKPGDHLQTDQSEQVTVLNVRNYSSKMVTYDLTINGLHTYYVVAGDTPVLVHNDSCPLDELLSKLPAKYGSGPTSGIGIDTQGNISKVITSGGGTYQNLVSLARGRLGAWGFFSNSSRAVDAEQKFAASMLNADGTTRIASADFVINHPGGVCEEPLGCDMSIPYILNEGQTLTVHWLDDSGVWHSNVYQGEG